MHDPAEGDRIAELIRSDDLEALAREAHPVALNAARKTLRGRDPHLVVTAANDAVLAVCRFRHQFRGHCRGATWVYAIARRKALTHARRAGRHAGRETSLELPGVRRRVDRLAAEGGMSGASVLEPARRTARPRHARMPRPAGSVGGAGSVADRAGRTVGSGVHRAADLARRIRNPSWREILRLHLQGLSADEIAERMGYTRGSVQVTLSKVKRRLREAS